MRVVTLRGRVNLVFGIIMLEGVLSVVILFKGCSEDIMYLFLFFLS